MDKKYLKIYILTVLLLQQFYIIYQHLCINILEQIKSYNKQVIILEDNNVSFLTPLWCMFTNLQFLNHPLNFKTGHEWKKLLSKYFRIKNLKVDSDACVLNLFPLKDNIYVK